MNRRQEILWLLLILAGAVAIRLAVVFLTPVINPDGPIYLHQAQAVARGDLAEATRLLPFLSLYPLAVALCHLLIPDWLACGVAVSFAASTLVVLPLHLLLRCFFPAALSLAGTGALSFLPLWVCRSGDVLRDPLAWFWAVAGLACIARAVTRGRDRLLPLAGIALLVAAWCRVEYLWYLVAAILVLPLIQRRLRTALLVAAPLVAAAAAVILPLAAGRGDLLAAGRLTFLPRALAQIGERFTLLKDTLRQLSASHPGPVGFFLDEARSFFYLVGLGTMVNRILEAATYPFAGVALLGRGRIPLDGGRRHLRTAGTVVASGAVVILLAQVFRDWVLEYRYTLLATLPCTVLFTAGLGPLGRWCTGGGRLPAGAGLTLAALLLIASTLPKTLQPRRASETAFRQVGERVHLLEPGTAPVPVITSTSTTAASLVNFYANRYRQRLPGPQDPALTYAGFPHDDATTMVTALRRRGFRYLLWEENNRPSHLPLELAAAVSPPLREMGRWHNHQAGTMILYRLDGAP